MPRPRPLRRISGCTAIAEVGTAVFASAERAGRGHASITEVQIVRVVLDL